MAKRQTAEEFVDDEIYPVIRSAFGSNAFYHRCEEVGHSAPYASCLDRVQERKEGRLDAIYSTCSAAIGKKTCPAIAMRKEELAAGKAIYYINRDKLLEFNAEDDQPTTITSRPAYERPSIKIVKAQPLRAPEKPRVAVPAPAKTVEQSDNIYADAINAAVAEQKAASIEESTKSRVTPVMSPLDFIRRNGK